jgi:hypothetical protein
LANIALAMTAALLMTVIKRQPNRLRGCLVSERVTFNGCSPSEPWIGLLV